MRQAAVVRVILILLGASWSINAMGEANIETRQTEPLLVLDTLPNKPLKRFRQTTDLPVHAQQINWHGLQSLNLSASSQPSEQTIMQIKENSRHPIILVDLRQESHGFVNGLPVTWYTKNNGINHGLTIEETIFSENKLIDQLKITQNIQFHEVTQKQGGDIGSSKAHQILIQRVESEREFATRHGLEYRRFYIPDHQKPSVEMVAEFIDWYQQIEGNPWLHIHCRGGAGRTTTLMAMIDMIHHAKQVSFDDIILRQYLLGGRNLKEISSAPDKQWKKNWAQQRLEFLQLFYDYVSESPNISVESWRNWNTNYL